MNVITKQGETNQKGYTIEYKMGNLMAKQLIAEAKKKGLKKRPQEILVDYVNRECGLRGECVRVLVDVN